MAVSEDDLDVAAAYLGKVLTYLADQQVCPVCGRLVAEAHPSKSACRPKKPAPKADLVRKVKVVCPNCRLAHTVEVRTPRT